MYPLPDVSKFTEAPIEYFGEAEGIGVRATVLMKAGDCVGQHSHPYPHATLVGSGAVRLWAGEVYAGDYKRGQLIGIKAGVSHIFQALEDDTFMSCLTILALAEKGV